MSDEKDKAAVSELPTINMPADDPVAGTSGSQPEHHIREGQQESEASQHTVGPMVSILYRFEVKRRNSI